MAKRILDLVTTTRASDGYAEDTSGVWHKFSSNVPRVTSKGILVEEGRINSIRNNSMQGAVAGTPGTAPTNWTIGALAGLSSTIVGTGTENGIDYIDIRYFGTTNSTGGYLAVFEPSNFVTASVGQAWSISAFLKLVSGSFANITLIRLHMLEYPSGSSFETTTTSISGSINSTLTRFTNTGTTVQGTTTHVQPRIVFFCTNGAAVDFTLRIGWPQLELGASITSPIRTIGSTSTRLADTITYQNFNNWVNPTEGTLFAQLQGPLYAFSNTAIFNIQKDSQNFIQLWYWNGSHGNARFRMFNGNLSQADYTSTALSSGRHKIAGAYKANDVNFSFDGSVGTTDTSASLPSGFTSVTTGALNTYIERLVYFPTRLTNAQLQALTA